MDLEQKLNATLEVIAPSAVSSYKLKSFTDDLINLLDIPTRTTPQLESLLYNFKINLNIPTQYETVWRSFEDIIFPMLSMNNKLDMINHLDRSYARLQETLFTIKHQRNKMGSVTLNKENLENYNNFQEPIISPSVYAESFETLDKLSDRRSMLSSNHDYNMNDPSNRVSLRNLIEPYYINTLPEEEIIRNISYTLLGTTCDVFPIKNDSILFPTSVSNAVSGNLHLLFEGGLLYKDLSQKVEYYKYVSISPLKLALIVAVEEHLNKYAGFINSVMSSGKPESLQSLYLKFYDCIISLRIYFYFMNSFHKLRGDELLSQFHSYLSHGDKMVRSVALDLYNNLISLYFEYLKDWLLLGKVEDTYIEEFFINRKEKDNKNHHSIPFTFEKTKIPQFLPYKTAYEIFIIGKTYNFITVFCKELQWANDLTSKYTMKYQKYTKQNSVDFSGQLLEVIHQHYLEIVQHTNDVLKTKFYYPEVIHILKDILLMGRSDLIDIMLIKAKDILNQPIVSLKNFAFTRILQEAIQQSSFRNCLNKKDNNFLINKLDARLLNMGKDLLGWDVFTLDYIIHPPLSTVLNVNRNDGRKEYLQIYNFLWRFKRNEFFSNEEMIRSKQLIRSFKKNNIYSPLSRDLSSKLSKLSILRSRLQQFNYKIESYYTQSIIEKNFVELESKLKLTGFQSESSRKVDLINYSNGSVSFDGILKPKNDLNSFGISDNVQFKEQQPNIEDLDNLHNDFLQKILSHKLFSSITSGKYSKQPYSRSIIFIFEEILEFIQHYSQLNEIAYNIYLQINLRNNVELQDLINKFNTKSNETVETYKNFQKATYTFIMDLRDDGDEELRQLSRLLR